MKLGHRILNVLKYLCYLSIFHNHIIYDKKFNSIKERIGIYNIDLKLK